MEASGGGGREEELKEEWEFCGSHGRSLLGSRSNGAIAI